MTAPSHDTILTACTALLPRLGAQEFEIRYSESESCDKHKPGPTVWLVVASFAGGPLGNDVPPQVAAGLSPAGAAYKLLEQLVDGGQCQHCKRPTGITLDFNSMPAARAVCWYQFDPELKQFRRGCE